MISFRLPAFFHTCHTGLKFRRLVKGKSGNGCVHRHIRCFLSAVIKKNFSEFVFYLCHHLKLISFSAVSTEAESKCRLNSIAVSEYSVCYENC